MEEVKIKIYKNGELFKGKIQESGTACYTILDVVNDSETIING